MRTPTFHSPAVTVPPQKSGDPRFAHLLGSELSDGSVPQVCLIGFPCDEGVRRNNGRTGAAAAPQAIREALYRLAPDAQNPAEFTALLKRTLDCGDVPVSGDLEDDQTALGRAVAWAIGRGSIVIVLGGGHETSFGHFLGYVELERAVSILNVDAHPDVRPLLDGKGNSGTQFRQALEHPSKRCKRYEVIGLQPHATAAEHVEFIRKHGGQALFRESLSAQRVEQALSSLSSPAFVSFDIDAVDEAWAPGVSSPTMGGLHPDFWFHMAALAGAASAVSSIDVVEFNPTYDQDGKSARLSALTVWHFLAGVARRLASQKKPRLGFGR